ncbi:MAG: hypothetical protein WBL57_04140 [Methylovirgula sp.]
MASDQIPDKGSQDEKPVGEPGKQDHAKSLSADFVALIEAIKAEGRAYRREEQQEDSAKRFREWITIVLLACTLTAVGWQVHEMIKVYGPIRDQANAEKTAADAATKQSANSEKTLVESQRAWVGPINASIAAEPTIGKPVEITITYQNTGHEPALGFTYLVETFLTTADEVARGITQKRLATYMQECKKVNQWIAGSVVYPTVGFSSYSLNSKSRDDLVDDAFTKGNKVMFVEGCFVYRTFDMPRHSYFCYFYTPGRLRSKT